MNIMILGLATVIVLSILSWLYQFRGLPSIWIKLLLPLLMGIGTVIAWGDHIIIGFIYGAFIGLMGVPIMLAIKPKHGSFGDFSSEKEKNREEPV